MIRPVVASDVPAVVELAVDAGLFAEEESAIVEALMADYFARDHGRGHDCLLDVDDQQPVGVAYYRPTPATDRTLDLLMIAVRRDRHGQGRGTALLSQVEDDLRGRQQRLLLVETSGTPRLRAHPHLLRQMRLQRRRSGPRLLRGRRRHGPVSQGPAHRDGHARRHGFCPPAGL